MVQTFYPCVKVLATKCRFRSRRNFQSRQRGEKYGCRKRTETASNTAYCDVSVNVADADPAEAVMLIVPVVGGVV